MESDVTKGLLLSEQLIVPRQMVTNVAGIFAMRGMGKSYLAAVLMEEMVSQGLFVGFIDPLGIAWGIRSSADGEHKGLPVLIFGGRHGDVPLDPAAGKLVAQIVLELRQPFILDLSAFDEDDMRAFVADFLIALRQCEEALLHLIIDEADIFAPQFPDSAEARRSCKAMNSLARRYRALGIGATFICQRPAELHNGVMQFDLLLALCMTQPHDIHALDGWIKRNAPPEQRAAFLSTLVSLPVGTAWAWSPRWLHIFERVAIRARRTYDSSRTPDVDSRNPHTPKQLADIDISVISDQITALTARARETDPAFLQKRIRELEEQLRAALARGETQQVRTAQSRRSLAEEERTSYQARIRELEARVAELSNALEMQRGQPALTTPAVPQMPERLEIGQVVVHQVIAPGVSQPPSVVEAAPATPQALPGADLTPVEPQLKLLRTKLARLDKNQQRTLYVLATDQEGKHMSLAEIASWLYLQPSSMPSLQPLVDLGLIEVSKGSYGKHLYTSRLRQHLRNRFPRLDAEQAEQLVQHVLAGLPGHS